MTSKVKPSNMPSKKPVQKPALRHTPLRPSTLARHMDPETPIFNQVLRERGKVPAGVGNTKSFPFAKKKASPSTDCPF